MYTCNELMKAFHFVKAFNWHRSRASQVQTYLLLVLVPRVSVLFYSILYFPTPVDDFSAQDDDPFIWAGRDKMLVTLVKQIKQHSLTLCYVFMTHTCITLYINFENNCTKAWLEKLGANLRVLLYIMGVLIKMF